MEKADALFAQFGPSWSGVELLQEGAERYLKGYLISKGWALTRTHDLNGLLASACEYDPGFADHASTCQSLTEQFWEQHYPGGDLTEVGEDYEEMRKSIGEMISRILGGVS